MSDKPLIKKVQGLPPKKGVGAVAKYPFEDMDVNDAFFVPFDDGDAKRIKQNVAHACWRHSQKHAVKLVCRECVGRDFDEGYGDGRGILVKRVL